VTTILGLAGCGLLCIAVTGVALRLEHRPAGVRTAAMLGAAVCLFFPIGDLPLAGYVRGLTGDLSVPALVLAVNACCARLIGRPVFEGRDVDALLWLAAAAAMFLYPFALGWTPFDPYALGYGSVAFITALFLVTLAAWRAGLKLVVLVVLLAALSFLGGAYESRNLWDYLVDPLVTLYALLALSSRMLRRYLSSEARARA
jgi:hypothetical protein